MHILRKCVHQVGSIYKKNNSYCLLMPKPEGKGPLGIPRCKWEDNIKTDRKEVGCEDMDCTNIDKIGDRWRAVVSTNMKIRAP
jgi:hypothetical protein